MDFSPELDSLQAARRDETRRARPTRSFTTDQLAFSVRARRKRRRSAGCVESSSLTRAGNRFVLSRKGQSGAKYELIQRERGDSLHAHAGPRVGPAGPCKVLRLPGPSLRVLPKRRISLRIFNWAFSSRISVRPTMYYLGPLREFPQRHYAWKGSEPAAMGRREGEGGRCELLRRIAARRRLHLARGDRALKSLQARVAHWLKELGLDLRLQSRAASRRGTTSTRCEVQKTAIVRRGTDNRRGVLAYRRYFPFWFFAITSRRDRLFFWNNRKSTYIPSVQARPGRRLSGRNEKSPCPDRR